MKPKVFITRKIPEAGINLLKKRCIVKVYAEDKPIPRAELINAVKWCDALLCLLTDKIDAEIINANPELKIISNYAVGFDNIDIKAATERDIPVTNTPDVLTEAVAEHTFALMLAISRRIPESDRFTRAGKYKGWSPTLFLGGQLEGKTLGVAGLGRIGSSVAKKAVCMGMKVIYTSRDMDLKFEKKFGAKFVSKEALFRKADFISLHIPLLTETRHYVGKKELTLMKKTAYLINTSRGPVVDEKGLVKALKTKKIAGAALDVYEFEPKLAKGLAKLSNAILTPHTASATTEARDAMAELAAKAILEVFSGKKPKNLVNKDVRFSFQNAKRYKLMQESY